MLADIIVKVAGFEKKKDFKYYPRPSLAGPERCIRQMVYWGSGIPKNKEVGDRLMMTMDDSLWHEQLTADWLRKSAFQLSSEQMGVDCEELDFIEPPISDKNDKVIVGAVSTIKETPVEVEGTPPFIGSAFKTLSRHGYRYCSFCEKAIPRNRLHGHIDGILTDMLMKDYHYEHKALSTYTFARYWAGEFPFDYITQTCLYNKGLRRVNPDIDTSSLLVKNKNSAQYIDYKILYDAIKDSANILEICHSSGKKKIENPYVFSIENIISDAMKKFGTVDEHIKSHTLPDRSYEMDHWRCFSPNTLVLMANGQYKEIKNIKTENVILSIDGPTKVIKIKKLSFDKKWVKIKPRGMLDTICTEDHKWLIAQCTTSNKYHDNEGFIPQLIAANKISFGNKQNIHNVLMPVHQPYKIHKDLNIDEAKLLGYYAAEGCLANWQNNKYYRVEFVLNPKENDIAQEIINLGERLFQCSSHSSIKEDKRPGQEGWKSRNIQFYSVKMADFMRSHIPGTATTKTLSSSIMGAPLEIIKAFLETAQKGDGCYNKKQNCNILSTSSRKLCLQYQQLYWRLGIPAIAQYANKPSIKFGYKTSQGYRVQYQGGNKHAIRFINIAGRIFAMTRIAQITQVEYEQEAWDLEVESIFHVFATESGLASNCNYCSYSETCWKDYEKEFASLIESSKIEGEVVDLCRLYLQLVNTEKDAKEHKDELRDKIVTLLKEQGIRKGKTGEGKPGDYTINYQVSTQKRLKKMEDIPKELLPLIVHEIPMERLTIRLIKEKH